MIVDETNCDDLYSMIATIYLVFVTDQGSMSIRFGLYKKCSVSFVLSLGPAFQYILYQACRDQRLRPGRSSALRVPGKEKEVKKAYLRRY